MNNFTEFLTLIQKALWSPPLLLFFIGTGIYFSIRLGFLQIFKIPLAMRFIFEKEKGVEKKAGFISLCQSLAATIGTGNIVGVATAVKAGGPGALFWMILFAFIVMSIKYAETLVSVKYRKVMPDGSIKCGPMIYMEHTNFKFISKIFAVLGVIVALIGVGTFAQVNAVVDSVHYTFEAPSSSIVLILVVAVALVLISGVTVLSKAANIAVPYITIFYMIGSIIIIITNIEMVPKAVKEIFNSAFSLHSATGGILGASIFLSMRYGIARGLFTNEAGMGCPTIVEGNTNSCVRQGIMSMMGTFFDTIILCSLTGIVIIMSGAFYSGADGAILACNAYNWGIDAIGEYIVTVGLVFFAFTTIIGWSYYGQQCAIYLWGEKSIVPYRLLFVGLIGITPFIPFEIIWAIADITNGMIIIPNLIVLLSLRGVIISETALFFRKAQAEITIKGL